MPLYPMWTVDPSSPMQYLPWLVLMGTIGWCWTRRAGWGRHALLGLGFFLINLAPFIGFTAAAYMDLTWVMDHVLYLPMIGLIGLVVAGLGQIDGKLSASIRPIGRGITAIIMGLLAWESHAYAGIYIDQVALWTHEVQHNPESFVGHLNLGHVFELKEDAPQAMEQYEQASKINPDKADPYYDIGNLFMETGRFSEAVAPYQQALKIDPNHADAHCNLGIIFFKLNRFPEAIEQYRQALRIKPHDAETHGNLGVALMQTGQISEAIEQFQQGLEINPNLPGIRTRLEEALAKLTPIKN